MSDFKKSDFFNIKYKAQIFVLVLILQYANAEKELKISREISIEIVVKSAMVAVTSSNWITVTTPKIFREGRVINSSQSDATMIDLYSFLVVFADKDYIRVPCIGALIDNSSIISTDSCLEPYRKLNLTASIGFGNDTEAISVGRHRRHYDYVKYNKSESDIIRVKTTQNVKAQSINLENNIDRSLTSYTNGSFQLYRVTVDKHYTPSKELVTADKIKDCGHLIFCLEDNLKEREHRVGSLLVAVQKDKFTLLGMEQNRIIQNNLVPYTKLPLHVVWLQ